MPQWLKCFKDPLLKDISILEDPMDMKANCLIKRSRKGFTDVFCSPIAAMCTARVLKGWMEQCNNYLNSKTPFFLSRRKIKPINMVQEVQDGDYFFQEKNVLWPLLTPRMSTILSQSVLHQFLKKA